MAVIRLHTLGLSIALLAVALPSAGGEIYQWTDATGERRFSTELGDVPEAQRDAAVARARALRSTQAPASQPPAALPPANASAGRTVGARVPGIRASHFSPEAFTAWRENLLGRPRPSEVPRATAGVTAVLMETGFENGSGTLFVQADGSAEMLLSVGGGVIGGGDLPAINARARSLVALAARELRRLPPVAQAPLPKLGEVRFTVLTEQEIRSATASRAELGSGRHPLSALFLAGHGVITALREASEAKGVSP